MKKSLSEVLRSFMKSYNVILGTIGFTFGIGIIVLLSIFVQIAVSETDSHSKHYFLHLKFNRAKIDDYCLIDSKWYGKKIIKRIVGIEGDRIWYDEQNCLWVGNQKIGLQKSISKDKRTLNPIKAQIIPKGYVFVYSEHDSSFDSRYQELGLVPVNFLEGKVIPLI